MIVLVVDEAFFDVPPAIDALAEFQFHHIESMHLFMDDTRQRYQRIHDELKAAIQSRHAKPGLVLVEGPLADIFGTSRAPVRRAFEMLHSAGFIQKFQGRGYVVAAPGAKTAPLPLRVPLTPELFGLHETTPLQGVPSVTEFAFDALQATVSLAIVFGHFRIDEAEAAEIYNVSRATIRDALSRLRDLGLVEKSPYSNWLCGPLTAKSIAEDYELRILLEPVALLQSAPFLKKDELQNACDEIDASIGKSLSIETLDRLEDTLHVALLAKATNEKMCRMINSTHMPLTVNHAFFHVLKLEPDTQPFIEHREVLKCLILGDFDSAAVALAGHLKAAKKRTLQRLKVFAVLPDLDFPSYMRRLT